jgi:hypothetical protein
MFNLTWSSLFLRLPITHAKITDFYATACGGAAATLILPSPFQNTWALDLLYFFSPLIGHAKITDFYARRVMCGVNFYVSSSSISHKTSRLQELPFFFFCRASNHLQSSWSLSTFFYDPTPWGH